jgi:hypothetical protein
MTKINLYWWRNISQKTGNFGDELSPYIIERLTGKKTVYVHENRNSLRFLLSLIKNMLFCRVNLRTFFFYLKSLIKREHIIAIGSILEMASSSNTIVWGSGLMFRKGNVKKCRAFLAVRGNESRKRLLELGYECSPVLGDPALLLPLVYTPKAKKNYTVGIIPHYKNHEEAVKIFKNSNILVINLFDDIEKIVDEINSCECTISSSLHGLIVSHAYGIKSIWGKFMLNEIGGDNIKFKDYFSSVMIAYYEPVKITNDVEMLLNYFHNYTVLPNVDLNQIRKSLIEIAPFNVLPKFK